MFNDLKSLLQYARCKPILQAPIGCRSRGGIGDNTTLVTDNLAINKSNPSEFSENMP